MTVKADEFSIYYTKDPESHKNFAPRGVIHSYADDRIEDFGPMTCKGMETADEEFMKPALKFIDNAHAGNTPFYVWMGTTF